MVPGKDKNNLRRLLLIFTFLQHSLSQFPCLAQEDDFDVLFLPPALVLQHILQRLANALAFLFTFARSKSKLGKPEFHSILKAESMPHDFVYFAGNPPHKDHKAQGQPRTSQCAQ